VFEVKRNASFVYADQLAGYDLGPEHPLKPIRLRMVYELLKAYGVFDSEPDLMVEATPASEAEILQAHDSDYVDAVRKLSRGEHIPSARDYGFGYADNPPFPGMYEASLLYTGASLTAARQVMLGESQVSFSISGGLHHALRNRASGFCIFNDPSVAIHELLHKFSRVTYIDIDAHHGDGVQYAFEGRSDVLTISIHESGDSLFPGTGFPEDIGSGAGAGYSVNMPVAAYTDDATWLRVLQEIVPPLLESFSPDVIVAQLGADGHFGDPLTHLNLTTAGWLQAVKMILGLGRPVIALGGGGYNLSSVTRMWTLAYAAMLDVELPDEIPASFAAKYGIQRLRDAVPPVVSASQERRAAEYASDTIAKIKGLVFPIHGINASGC
jgi:acetoin utilization protein AcuC